MKQNERDIYNNVFYEWRLKGYQETILHTDRKERDRL